MSLPRVPEPCMCGDPECPRCFPRMEQVIADWLYEEWRDMQNEVKIAPIDPEDQA